MQKKITLKMFILKMLLINMFLTGSLFSASLSSAEITRMVSEIKKERKGIDLLTLQSTENPFRIRIAAKKEEVVEVNGTIEIIPVVVEVVYTLKAILNKAAFIDKKWYKLGDSIGDYKVSHISSSSVVLKNESTTRILSLEKKKNQFIKLNRGY
ncbi:MAG: Unknown protein [uncultured Sulfurovum sp.]|uniref:Uncharacterized protein n=1 Tax=uncultured Sulfurovum sp. TaxID=269237 RepID=A0A6S6T321_9BACT|nr:MAG: Unknown protein [uncultured Sulfurovum sp.]